MRERSINTISQSGLQRFESWEDWTQKTLGHGTNQDNSLVWKLREQGAHGRGVSDQLMIAQLGLEARSPNWPSRALSIILWHQRAGLLQQHWETRRCHLRLPVHRGLYRRGPHGRLHPMALSHPAPPLWPSWCSGLSSWCLL